MGLRGREIRRRRVVGGYVSGPVCRSSAVNPVVGQLPEPVMEEIAAGVAICVEYR